MKVNKKRYLLYFLCANVALLLAVASTAIIPTDSDINTLSISTLPDSTLDKNPTKNKTLIYTNPLGFESDEYTIQIKEKLSETEIQKINKHVAKAAKNEQLDDFQLRELELKIAGYVMKHKVAVRYEHESPTPSDTVSVTDSEQDFYSKILSYYDEGKENSQDEGEAIRLAIKDVKYKDAGILGLYHIQDLYNDQKEAPSGSYEMLLAYYNELENVKQTPAVVRLKAEIKAEFSDGTIRIGKLKNIKKRYLEVKKSNALIASKESQ